MTTEEEYVSEDEYFRLQREYWRQVGESDGFDIENVSIPSPMIGRITGLLPYDCQGAKRFPFPALVKNYARLGLDRYNMLEGTDFKLFSLLKFNMLQNCVSSYFMTLIGRDEVAFPTEADTFQVRIDEERYGSLDLTVSIARIKTEASTKKPFIPHFHGGAVADGIFKGELPDWPSDNDLKDNKRFYEVKKSEWEDNDWICRYLELVLCSHDRSITNTVLSKLRILKVAIETSIELEDAPPIERLKAKSANVYILFKGLEFAQAPHQFFQEGVNVHRRVIIRRIMDHTGYLTLVGKLCDGRLQVGAV